MKKKQTSKIDGYIQSPLIQTVIVAVSIFILIFIADKLNWPSAIANRLFNSKYFDNKTIFFSNSSNVLEFLGIYISTLLSILILKITINQLSQSIVMQITQMGYVQFLNQGGLPVEITNVQQKRFLLSRKKLKELVYRQQIDKFIKSTRPEASINFKKLKFTITKNNEVSMPESLTQGLTIEDSPVWLIVTAFQAKDALKITRHKFYHIWVCNPERRHNKRNMDYIESRKGDSANIAYDYAEDKKTTLLFPEDNWIQQIKQIL